MGWWMREEKRETRHRERVVLIGGVSWWRANGLQRSRLASSLSAGCRLCEVSASNPVKGSPAQLTPIRIPRVPKLEHNPKIPHGFISSSCPFYGLSSKFSGVLSRSAKIPIQSVDFGHFLLNSNILLAAYFYPLQSPISSRCTVGAQTDWTNSQSFFSLLSFLHPPICSQFRRFPSSLF